MRTCQTVDYVKNGPIADELIKLRLLFLLFLLLRLNIYINDSGLSCGLLLDYTLNDNDIVDLRYVRRNDQRRGGLRLLCLIVRGCRYEKSGRV